MHDVLEGCIASRVRAAGGVAKRKTFYTLGLTPTHRATLPLSEYMCTLHVHKSTRGAGAWGSDIFSVDIDGMRYVHERFLPLSRAHVSPELSFNPLPSPGIVVGAVHGRRGTRAATRGAPGAAW